MVVHGIIVRRLGCTRRNHADAVAEVVVQRPLACDVSEENQVEQRDARELQCVTEDNPKEERRDVRGLQCVTEDSRSVCCRVHTARTGGVGSDHGATTGTARARGTARTRIIFPPTLLLRRGSLRWWCTWWCRARRRRGVAARRERHARRFFPTALLICCRRPRWTRWLAASARLLLPEALWCRASCRARPGTSLASGRRRRRRRLSGVCRATYTRFCVPKCCTLGSLPHSTTRRPR